MIISAMSLALAAASVVGAEQFDLLCSGKVEDRTTYKSKPIERRYHVDLAKGQFCYDNCTIRPIAEVNNSIITFEQTKAAYKGDTSRNLDFVRRTDGYWTFFTSYWSGEGRCEPAPFTGFPSEPTKF